MEQDERRAGSFLLIVNAHAVDVSEVAVFRVGNTCLQLVKREVRRPRKPKDGEGDE